MASNTADCYNHHKKGEKYGIVNDAREKSFETSLRVPEHRTLNEKGRLCTVDHFVRISCFLIKSNNVCITKRVDLN